MCIYIYIYIYNTYVLCMYCVHQAGFDIEVPPHLREAGGSSGPVGSGTTAVAAPISPTEPMQPAAQEDVGGIGPGWGSPPTPAGDGYDWDGQPLDPFPANQVPANASASFVSTRLPVYLNLATPRAHDSGEETTAPGGSA